MVTTPVHICILLFYVTYAVASIPSVDAPTTARKERTVYNQSKDSLESRTMMKRFEDARMTWYEVGLWVNDYLQAEAPTFVDLLITHSGACGHINYETEWVSTLTNDTRKGDWIIPVTQVVALNTEASHPFVIWLYWPENDVFSNGTEGHIAIRSLPFTTGAKLQSQG